MDSSPASKRTSTTTNGYSALPEVDTQKHEEFDGKELRTVEGKETVFRDIGGLEVQPAQGKQYTNSSGKEVAGSDGKERVETSAHYGDAAEYGVSDHDEQRDSVPRRKRRRVWLIGGIVMLVILGVALGVGLGVGLQSNDRTQEQSQPAASASGGATDGDPSSPSTLSTRGAFNGSSISMRRQGALKNLTSGAMTTSDSDDPHLILVFQHYSGDIRWMQRVDQDTWQGGSPSESITTWATNSTPLSVLSSSSTAEGTTEWHVFCKLLRRGLSTTEPS